MNRIEINALYSGANNFENTSITVCGWIRTVRVSKNFGFMEINDGHYDQIIRISPSNTTATNHRWLLRA